MMLKGKCLWYIQVNDYDIFRNLIQSCYFCVFQWAEVVFYYSFLDISCFWIVLAWMIPIHSFGYVCFIRLLRIRIVTQRTYFWWIVIILCALNSWNTKTFYEQHTWCKWIGIHDDLDMACISPLFCWKLTF